MNDVNAYEYGRALFLLTEETGITEDVKKDVDDLFEILAQNREYSKLMDTPALTKAERLSLIEAALSPLAACLVDLAMLLAEQRAAHALPLALSAFTAEYEASRGIERVVAVTARPLTEEQSEKLRLKLAKQTGKHIIVRNEVDPEILGGVKLRYAGKQVDGSVKTRFDNIEKQIRRTVV